MSAVENCQGINIFLWRHFINTERKHLLKFPEASV